MCLPSVYLISPHLTRSPRPSPSILDIANLKVGTTWKLETTPVIATYPLSFPEGPIWARKVAPFLATICSFTKGWQPLQTNSVSMHWSCGILPRWIGASPAACVQWIYIGNGDTLANHQIVKQKGLAARTHIHTYAKHLHSALVKCLKAVSPSPPTPHTMYWFWLVGSMVMSQVESAAVSVHVACKELAYWTSHIQSH